MNDSGSRSLRETRIHPLFTGLDLEFYCFDEAFAVVNFKGIGR
jgi:hypothetical protein